MIHLTVIAIVLVAVAGAAVVLPREFDGIVVLIGATMIGAGVSSWLLMHFARRDMWVQYEWLARLIHHYVGFNAALMPLLGFCLIARTSLRTAAIRRRSMP